MSLGPRQAWTKGTNQQHVTSLSVFGPSSLTGMVVLTSSGKAGCLANLANPIPNQKSLYTVCGLYTRRPDDALAQKEGFIAMMTSCFPKSKVLWSHPLISSRRPECLIDLMAVWEATSLMNDWQSAVFKILDAQCLFMMFSQMY